MAALECAESLTTAGLGCEWPLCLTSKSYKQGPLRTKLDFLEAERHVEEKQKKKMIQRNFYLSERLVGDPERDLSPIYAKFIFKTSNLFLFSWDEKD